MTELWNQKSGDCCRDCLLNDLKNRSCLDRFGSHGRSQVADWKLPD